MQAYIRGKAMMECSTAASVISYVSSLELQSAKLYEEWANLHQELRDPLESFAKTNRKNEQRVKRAYYSVVSDALETGFCFKDLKADIALPALTREAKASEILNLAITLEHEITDFYGKAANSSKAMLADVSRQMEKVAQDRRKRIEQLQSMANRF
jgi:hypothetical protein